MLISKNNVTFVDLNQLEMIKFKKKVIRYLLLIIEKEEHKIKIMKLLIFLIKIKKI